MANSFSKQVTVAFDEILEGFEDALVLSKMVDVYKTDQQTMERSNDTIWRPQPYIMQTFAGNDQTSNFGDVTQLSVPATIGFQRAAPWVLTAKQLRDALQSGRLVKSAKQRLASDMNVSVLNVLATQGTLVTKRTVAATGFDDIAAVEAQMNEQGVPMDDRKIALSTRDYNGMASNLAGRQIIQAGLTQNAYENAKIPGIVSFDARKLDYAYSLAAATATTVTVNGANQRYVPKATVTNADGSISNVDNRYQNLIVAVGASTVKVGDAFTIAGVFACHHITKQSAGNLKTFRVTGIVSGAGGSGTIQISPPIISADSSPTAAELMYQNTTAAPANGAVITFLNTVTASANPYWQGEAIELLPGRLMPEPDSGLSVMRGTTDSGFELTMTRQGSILDLSTKYRIDALWGVTLLQPEMAGIELFNQT